MADLTTFKTYDPIAQIIASGGGASSLPLIGGTLMGNLILTPPFRVIQCQTPGNPCDVVNLVYLQALYLPLTGSTMSGAISQPMAPVAPNDLTNKAYVDAQSTSQKFIAFAKNLSDQAMIPDGLVEFTPLTINRPSTQGLTITDSINGGVFSITLGSNRPQIFLKITVSISGLYTPGVIAKFFTYNLTNAAYTLGPGMILNNGNATQITSTHTYSEILTILPGTTTDIGVRLRTITGAGIIDIGNGGGVSLPYRWIMFEEI